MEYKGMRLDCGYRMDIRVEETLVLTLKRVDEVNGIHEAQPLTCMKLAGVRTGLLISINLTKLKNGIERFVI